MITQVEAEIELGYVQVTIEHLVEKHNISITEWNLKTKRVEKILGHLLQQRDRMLGIIRLRSTAKASSVLS